MAATAAVFEEERKIHFSFFFKPIDSCRNFSEDKHHIVSHQENVTSKELLTIIIVFF